MKNNYSLRGILLCQFLLYSIICQSQTAGDLLFTAFNTDGDKDFAIVILTDIPPNSTIYFTDDESDGTGNLAGSEGTITWQTGSKTIYAGTSIVFTDVDNNSNPNFKASIGTISRTGAFSLSGSKDGLIAFVGTDENTPTAFLAALQIGNDTAELGPFDGDGITLSNTGLAIGTSITIIDNVASPDGGKYTGSRSDQTSFSNYVTQLLDGENNWTTVSSSGDGETLLPYSQEAVTTQTTNWTGATSNLWNLSSNWSNGIPTNASLVTIPDVTNAPIISSGTEATVGNLTIENNETLTINSNNFLSINGNLTVNGNLNANSASSLIIKGEATGEITYQRTLTSNWHLISNPLESQDIKIFVVTDIATNAVDTNGSNYGLATYNNDAASWNYFTTTTINSAGNFNLATGYSILRSTAGNITFKGNIPTENISITATDGTANTWNLIGNPFPSYYPVNSNANSSTNFLTNNSAKLDAAFQALYFWNGSSYSIVNHASASRHIAPGQGFFIKTIESGAVINFSENAQEHQSTDVFNKIKETFANIELYITNGSQTKNTTIRYITGSTTGLDPGFDAGAFSGNSTNFSLYSQLVSDNNNINFSLQVLPENDYENLVIPIGLLADKNSEIEFSVQHQNLPNSMMIFLEDKAHNNIIRLDNNQNTHKIKLQEDENGIGRFFLHTSVNDLSKTLTIHDEFLKNFSIYISSKKTLNIINNARLNTRLKLYSVLGKILFERELNRKKTYQIQLPNSIKTGIYLVRLQNNFGSITKKIFIP